MRLILGDCLEVMRGMEPNSVDAIVTDPPYGLSFMGKEWDHGIPGVAFWIEALRVAKPGAHLLAFGGSRTFHRLTCAIEDAGWEIRDCLMYVYGSGFPKSHNIGCKCGGDAVPYSHEGTKAVSEHDLRPVRESDLSEAVYAQDKQGQVLFEGMQKHGLSTQGREQLPASEIRPVESGVEGRGDILPQAWELQADKIYPLSDGIQGDGSEGRICDGASPHNGKGNRKAAIEAGGRPSQESRSAGQPTRKSRTVRVESGAQDSRICPTCGGLLDRIGYGSALKPAFEPIILARKPLDGTLVQNSMKWGTGAINVDGCRVAWVGTKDAAAAAAAAVGFRRSQENGAKTISYGNTRRENVPQYDNTVSGRWPANLIHDGSEEVMELFPSSKSTGGVNGGKLGASVYGKFKNEIIGQNAGGLGDSGSAARFFYCAKASRTEREMGMGDAPDGPPMRWNKAGVWTDDTTPAKNNHPTVKPLALMRYLCRLITPPNGTIQDPFMGSGTTGIAAKAEGFDFIGIELNQEYMEIAERRIIAARRDVEDTISFG